MGAGSSLPADQNQNAWSIEATAASNQLRPSPSTSSTFLDKEATNTTPIQVSQNRANSELAAGWPNVPLQAASAMEKVELSRTVSHLAAANQQLAAAHNLTISHLQWLFGELRKQPQQQPSRIPVDDSTEKRGKVKCPNCRNKESESRSSIKVRSVTGRQGLSIKTANRRLRRLRKFAALDASREENCQVLESTNEKSKEIEDCLRREIEDLNARKSESQITNDRLTHDLEEQRLLVERLQRDFEESRREYETKERRLEQVSETLKRSELESARLLAELETFQCERSSAENLAKEEAEKSTALRARLAEQHEERRKQTLALDEATQQIRALELAAQANAPANLSEEASREKSPSSVGESVEPEPSTNASSSSMMEEFKKVLILKREARQRAIASISSEMDRLKRDLESEKTAHSETAKLLDELREAQARSKTDDALLKKTDAKTSEHVEALRLSNLLKISDEVTSELWLQLERTDDLRFQLENEPDEHRLRIGSLKRLTEETRATLRARKQQVNMLKDRLAQILVRLGDRRFLEENDEIREEAERQIEDIARTRSLCDERSRILAELKEQCYKQIHELKVKLDSSRKENQTLDEDLKKTEDKMDTQDTEILNLESQLGLAKADCRDLQNQLSVINSLFSQMLLSASSAEMDLDRLTRLLQENHDLISEMAKENCTEAAALPKLLLDIIEQVDGRARENEEKKEEDDLQEDTIAHNLPKVWRILLELLSCHAAGKSGADSASSESAPDSCYKSVDTPTGPRLVISVSKTYIRLKELILEKKHLEKEMNRMKQLNTHLESKLSEQEKRLSTVSDELSKTWSVVGRMQAQHQQLHTHEKILRYELQQKRKMLQELKQELEYCREKWESARQKNSVTEMQWRSLRREFAARKSLGTHTDSFNNSAESGFSDEREEESDEDEDEREIGKRVRPINARRRTRKDGSRAETPDTESEQPTDTELSESKTASSLTSGQRTPTPETEAELETSEVIGEDPSTSNNSQQSEADSSTQEETLDPFDKALTNVIQNLIRSDERNYTGASSGSESETVNAKSSNFNVTAKPIEDKTCLNYGATEDASEQSNYSRIKVVKGSECINVVAAPEISVFTIGPFPCQSLAAKNVQFSNPLIVGPSSRSSEESHISEQNLNPSTSSISVEDKKSLSAASIFSTEAAKVSTVSSSSLETVKEFPTEQKEKSIVLPSSSTSSTKTERTDTKITEKNAESSQRRTTSDFPSAEALDARALRLRNLEKQTELLVKRVNDTNRRGSALSSRLEELHETYGSMPVAPPLPDVLPIFRLPTEVNNRPTESGSSEVSEQTNNSEIGTSSKDAQP